MACNPKVTTVTGYGMRNTFIKWKMSLPFLALLAMLCGHPASVAGQEAIEEADYQTWHLPNGATARLGKGTIGFGDRELDVSTDGRTLAIGSRVGVWLYDGTRARTLALLPSPDRIASVSFSPDGSTLAHRIRGRYAIALGRGHPIGERDPGRAFGQSQCGVIFSRREHAGHRQRKKAR